MIFAREAAGVPHNAISSEPICESAGLPSPKYGRDVLGVEDQEFAGVGRRAIDQGDDVAIVEAFIEVRSPPSWRPLWAIKHLLCNCLFRSDPATAGSFHE
jgi:hypothetical protein